MISSLLGTFRWTLSLGSKFARVVPFRTLFIISLTLISQIATLVASLLPLKVIILLGSENIPSYFPGFLIGYGHSVLIGLLSLGAIAVFLMHLLAERLISWQIEKATIRLLSMSQKMSLFEQQDKIAQNAYLRFSRALASTVFIFIVFVGLVFFYPAMVIVYIAYVLLATMLLWMLYEFSDNFRENIETQPGPMLNVMSGIGFFVAFIFLIVDFIFFHPPVVLVAIISLLLSRQVMNHLSSVIINFFMLQRERIKLDALFFHGKVFMPQQIAEHRGIWSLLSNEARNQWVESVVTEFELNPHQLEVYCDWQQVGVLNVGALRVRVGSESYLFKLYETNRTALAQHELALLSENIHNLPSLKLIASTQVSKNTCLILHLKDGAKPETLSYLNLSWKFRERVLATSVPAALVNHYKRSKPLLWQRLTALPLERLQMAVDTEENKHLLELFNQKLPLICQILSGLPMTIVNPNLGVDSLWMQADETVLSLEWGLWSIEPIGASWPEQEVYLKRIKEVWPELVSQRKDLANIRIEHVELATLMFALERDFNRNSFTQVIKLLPRILERVDIKKNEE